MLSLPYFDADSVRQLLDYDGCIAAVRVAMRDLTNDSVEQPLRGIQHLGPGKLFATMPGALSANSGFGAKLVTAFDDPADRGRSVHRGLVLLFDGDTGELAALADAGEVTAIRTAAASAVATDALARNDANRLGIFGCGAEAATHIHAIARVRPIAQVEVWGRTLERADAFARRMAADTGLDIKAVADPQSVAAHADILCTVTSSDLPVLLGDWVRPGTHINAVGSGHPGPVEVDSELVIKSRYVADSRKSALAAASEFLVAKQAGLIRDEHIAAEIGEILLGRVSGRQSDNDITLYKSLGHIVQDLAALRYIVDRARDGSSCKQ